MNAYTRLIILCMAAAGLASAEAGVNIAEIRAMPPEAADKALPVELEGTLLYEAEVRNTFFIDDGSGSCFLEIPDDIRPAGLGFGKRLKVVGTTAPGGFLSQIKATEITVLGSGEIPEAKRVTPKELFDPDLDGQWIEVEGIIRRFNRLEEALAFELQIDGWTVLGLLPPSHPGHADTPWHLLQSRVRVRAIRGTNFNDRRQMIGVFLSVPAVSEVTPLDNPGQVGKPRVVGFGDLLRPRTDPEEPVAVRGVVTHVDHARGTYLREEKSGGGALLVIGGKRAEVWPGDLVEARGLPMIADFRPQLNGLEMIVLRAGPPPLPIPLDLKQPRNSAEHGELVSVVAEFRSLGEGPEGRVLLCGIGDHTFEARLPWGHGSLESELQPGSTLRLEGICHLKATRFLTSPEYIGGFDLLLRSPSDIQVVKAASPWTVRRLLWLLAILAGAGVVVVAWNFLLHRTVKVQTDTIRRQAEAESTHSERQRIARELHDTLEQELAGVNLLLEDVHARGSEGGKPVQETLALGLKMLRHCREETRASIRGLRSPTLEELALPQAIEERLEPLAELAGVRFSVTVNGDPRRLYGRLERNLLRIAQEAVSNAGRHARATSISVTLGYSPDTIEMEITDDGVGFDPAQPSPGGHFGLLGMRERTDRIYGTLSVSSSSSQGTTIRIAAPTANPEDSATPLLYP